MTSETPAQPPAAPETDVNALRGVLAAATPGPWVQNDPPRHAKVRTTGLPDDLDDEIATTIEASDATLIVAAVNALPAILDERDRLQRWKDEALPVILGLQDLGKALGLRLGTTITGPDAVEAARALTARAESAEAAHEALRADALGLLPDECWVTRHDFMRCTDMIGGGFESGAKWTEGMCCLPCRLRALLAGGDS